MCTNPIHLHVHKKHAIYAESIGNGFSKCSVSELRNRYTLDFTGRLMCQPRFVESVYMRDDRQADDYYIDVPCGKCPECAANYARKWSWRLEKDIDNGKCQAFMMTLTYAPDKLTKLKYRFKPVTGEIQKPLKYDPLSRFREIVSNPECFDIDSKKGIISRSKSRYNSNDKPFQDFEKQFYNAECIDYDKHGLLNYNDVQLFIKRLRRELKYWYDVDYVKYFGCGEYGKESRTLTNGKISVGNRPHYHLIVWYKPNTKCSGYYKYNKRKSTRKYLLPLVTSYDGASVHVPKLTSDLFQYLCFKCWNKSTFVNWNCSPVRNLQASCKYVTKYIVKQLTEPTNYGSIDQRNNPMFRRMSQSIAKEFIESVAPSLVKNRDFMINTLNIYDGSKVPFFIPSTCLKWAYQKMSDTLSFICPEYAEMCRLREKYFEDNPIEFSEAKFNRIRKKQLLASAGMFADV